MQQFVLTVKAIKPKAEKKKKVVKKKAPAKKKLAGRAKRK